MDRNADDPTTLSTMDSSSSSALRERRGAFGASSSGHRPSLAACSNSAFVSRDCGSGVSADASAVAIRAFNFSYAH